MLAVRRSVLRRALEFVLSRAIVPDALRELGECAERAAPLTSTYPDEVCLYLQEYP